MLTSEEASLILQRGNWVSPASGRGELIPVSSTEQFAMGWFSSAAQGAGWGKTSSQWSSSAQHVHLAGVHLVSLPSFSQPRDQVCRRGVCCCQQQHLRRGSRLQLQSGRYGGNPRCKCASGRTPTAKTECCPGQGCRFIAGHVFITLQKSSSAPSYASSCLHTNFQCFFPAQL